jgi:hypothetical protein
MQFKSNLKQHFPLKDLGPLTSYLGMEVYRDRSRNLVYLHQKHYIDTIKHRFRDFPLRAFQTPLEVNHNLQLPSEDDKPVPGQERFPELVGSLVYLMTCTRPDISHALSVLGRFVGEGRHGAKHWVAALRVLGYVAHTADLQLTLGGSDSQLQGYTDASCQDDKVDRRSSQGYAFTLGAGAVSWKATKSPAVALSSCEAELYGGTAAAQELLWLKRLLSELGAPQGAPILWCDNQSTVAMTKDPVFSARSKHIEARYFFIRELVQQGEMLAQFIPGEDNVADIFTKPLLHGRHQKLTSLLGLTPADTPSRGCVESRSSDSSADTQTRTRSYKQALLSQ